MFIGVLVPIVAGYAYYLIRYFQVLPDLSYIRILAHFRQFICVFEGLSAKILFFSQFFSRKFSKLDPIFYFYLNNVFSLLNAKNNPQILQKQQVSNWQEMPVLKYIFDIRASILTCWYEQFNKNRNHLFLSPEGKCLSTYRRGPIDSL